MASGTRSQREGQRRTGGDEAETQLNPWDNIKSANTDMQELLDLCNASTNDEMELMMVDAVMTLKRLETFGLACPLVCQKYCRARALPNFDAGTRIEKSFQLYCPDGKREDTALKLGHDHAEVSPRTADSSNSKVSQFIRLFPTEQQFDGHETGIPYSAWSRKVTYVMRLLNIDGNTAAKALPLILKGSAESFLSASKLGRLRPLLDLLKKEFDAEETRMMRMLELRMKNFSVYQKRGVDIMSAFADLVADMTDTATRVGTVRPQSPRTVRLIRNR
ncbi:hypothetical protein FVE85_9531 [Porphyridium purpureum]|uniref:Uncharacterized protein n=1 Tax=Porphyridium purpureum TaxID=35688 RepID=A0A5J4YID0_PORPP|nr:hypothetical protein FVE85_9531 [Porphyridium purpureum]|eukprot:POR9453..scf261_15